MFRTAITYGALVGAVVLVIQLAGHYYRIGKISLEFYQGLTATIFACIGIFLGLKWTNSARKIKSPTSDVNPHPQEKIEQLGLTEREFEVLTFLASGKSNQEIADTLHLSLNTIKTHCAKLYEKLDVSRRTQAVQKGRELGLLP